MGKLPRHFVTFSPLEVMRARYIVYESDLETQKMYHCFITPDLPSYVNRDACFGKWEWLGQKNGKATYCQAFIFSFNMDDQEKAYEGFYLTLIKDGPLYHKKWHKDRYIDDDSLLPAWDGAKDGYVPYVAGEIDQYLTA